MRALGYRTVDALVDWLCDDSQALFQRVAPAEIAGKLAQAPTEAGEPFERVLEGLFRDVLPYTSRTGHPRYFAFVPSAGTWPGALGDFVASACNVYAGSWLESAGPTPARAGPSLDGSRTGSAIRPRRRASLVTGGSAANLTALACARETLVGSMRDDLVDLRLRPGALVARAGGPKHMASSRTGSGPAGGRGTCASSPSTARRRDRGRRGRRAGARSSRSRTPAPTNAGAVDPLVELASLCRAARRLAARRRRVRRLRRR